MKSLDQKKFRQKYNLFLVEGNKIIRELENSTYEITEIYTVDAGFNQIQNEKIEFISKEELKSISHLKTPKDSVAVCKMPTSQVLSELPQQLVLDGIQDPGNLGTIIRLADWFGIKQIICSEDCVDVYNPKVIQGTKGSFTRVQIFYQDLEKYLASTGNENIATDMDGENLYSAKFPDKFNLILGNEGNGLSDKVLSLAKKTVTIPRFGNEKATESLNVSMAAGIILGQIFGNKLK